jgi:hypothetical protein
MELSAVTLRYLALVFYAALERLLDWKGEY